MRGGLVLPARVSIAAIKQAVADDYRLPLRVICSSRLDREATRPRQLAMALACHLSQLSSPAIARHFNDCDHTTILYARDRTRERRAADPELDRRFLRIVARLTEPQRPPEPVQLDFLPGPLFDPARIAA